MSDALSYIILNLEQSNSKFGKHRMYTLLNTCRYYKRGYNSIKAHLKSTLLKGVVPYQLLLINGKYQKKFKAQTTELILPSGYNNELATALTHFYKINLTLCILLLLGYLLCDSVFRLNLHFNLCIKVFVVIVRALVNETLWQG